MKPSGTEAGVGGGWGAGLSPGMTEAQWDGVARGLGLPAQLERVVGMVLKGKRDKEIAREMRLSRPTVRTYLARLFERFGVSDRVGLVLYVCGVRLAAREDKAGEAGAHSGPSRQE